MTDLAFDQPLPPDLARGEPLLDPALVEVVRDSTIEEIEALLPNAPHLSAILRLRIEDDETAEQAGRHLAIAREEIARLREQADEWAARISSWFETRSRGATRWADYLDERLRDYGLRVRDASGGAVKSIDLPSVVVKTRQSGGAAEVVDDEAAAAWADAVPTVALLSTLRKHDDPPIEEDELRAMLVVRKPKVYLNALRKLVAIEDITIGYEATVTGSCGHEWTTVDRLHDGETYDATLYAQTTHRLQCPSCPIDAIDGGPPYVGVEELEVRRATEKRVVDLSGEPVPGTAVAPTSIEVSVTTRG